MKKRLWRKAINFSKKFNSDFLLEAICIKVKKNFCNVNNLLTFISLKEYKTTSNQNVSIILCIRKVKYSANVHLH